MNETVWNQNTLYTGLAKSKGKSESRFCLIPKYMFFPLHQAASTVLNATVLGTKAHVQKRFVGSFCGCC